MSNVINFRASTRAIASTNARRINAEIVPFPCQRGKDDEYRFYQGALKNALCELERAQTVGNYFRVGEWKDEIDVIRLHSEWCGYQDIAADCRNALGADRRSA
ncbi:MAG: hypothetical protein LCH99_07875 [Proteobacteria bacterium]|nr:hypothetical protein [Pseudomonadota bacterium]